MALVALYRGTPRSRTLVSGTQFAGKNYGYKIHINSKRDAWSRVELA